MKIFATEFLLSALVVSALAISGCSTDAGDRAGSDAYVFTLGSDTVGVETFTRTADRLTGRILTREPYTRVAEYHAELREDGTISDFELSWNSPGAETDSTFSEWFRMSFGDTAATVDYRSVRNGEETDTTFIRPAPRGTIPRINTLLVPVANFDQALRQTDFEGIDSTSVVHTLHPRGSRTAQDRITRVSENTYSWSFFNLPILARVDDTGSIEWYSAEGTTIKHVGVPAQVDFDALAARYARMDREGRGMGAASPRVQEEFTVGDADLTIDYSRPAKRGRTIWGEIVPWEQVWRTGANFATHFSTSRDLLIGDTLLPAGTYTFYSIYTPQTAHLIISSQTGQFGTTYDPGRDFARVPMTGKILDAPVERFTISVESTEEGGVLTLIWDQMRYEVPFRVRS